MFMRTSLQMIQDACKIMAVLSAFCMAFNPLPIQASFFEKIFFRNPRAFWSSGLGIGIFLKKILKSASKKDQVYDGITEILKRILKFYQKKGMNFAVPDTLAGEIQQEVEKICALDDHAFAECIWDEREPGIFISFDSFTGDNVCVCAKLLECPGFVVMIHNLLEKYMRDSHGDTSLLTDQKKLEAVQKAYESFKQQAGCCLHPVLV